jgi:hypothetical protein
MTDYQMPSVVFDPVSLLSQANRETGLSNFGDDSFREPFEVLVTALEEEGNLNPVGRFVQHERVLNTLKNRLRLSEYLRLYPEILDEEIIAPAVIVGLPRTGTTMLHRVLASDNRFFAPLWYEVRNPAPFMDWDPTKEDQRLVLAKAEVAALLESNPEIAAIHPMDPLGADEDILLLEHSFYSTVPNAFCNLPTYHDWLFSHSNQPGYDYLKVLMQCLQWQKKRASNDATNKKWLLKTPHHLHFLDCLLSTFPDAQIIQTHRDPIDTIPSISSFNYNLWITQADQVDATLVGKQWGDMFARGLKHAMQIRELHKHQFIDIGFKNLLQDPLNTSNSIFKFIGMPTTDESLAAMQQHRDQNQRDARPAHDYTLEEFGFSEDGIKANFADYRSQFSDYL